MFILLTFVGKLPEYIIQCVQQIRLFCDNDIFLITDDLESPFLVPIRDVIKLIPYQSVIDDRCTQLFNNNKAKFHYVKELFGREELFVRSLERFFLARNFLHKYKLSNCFFMEIDNLIYDDPNKWLSMFQRCPLAMMNHAPDHLATGVCYIRDQSALERFLSFVEEFINSSHNEFISEMLLFYKYKELGYNDIQLLPIVFSNNVQNGIDVDTYKLFDDYGSVFDGAAWGTHFLGVESIYRFNPEFITSRYLLQARNYQCKWDLVDGLKKPFVFDEKRGKWVLINNLHVHSKNLLGGLSK